MGIFICITKHSVMCIFFPSHILVENPQSKPTKDSGEEAENMLKAVNHQSRVTKGNFLFPIKDSACLKLSDYDDNINNSIQPDKCLESPCGCSVLGQESEQGGKGAGVLESGEQRYET